MRYTSDDTLFGRLSELLRDKSTDDALCTTLGIDSTGLERAINEMRIMGYDIVRNDTSWHLAKDTENLLPWEVARGLGTQTLGAHIEYYDTTGSTQDHAIDAANNNATHGHTVIARTQDSGRGRDSRSWISPAGGVYMSVLVRSSLVTDSMSVLPLAASCALSRAISDTLRIETQMLWPNDLVITRDGELFKIAGMIVDAATGSDATYAVVGVGINFRVDADTINSGIDDGAARRAASLLHTQAGSPRRLVQSFLRHLEAACARTDASSIVEEWSAMSGMVGRTVTVSRTDADVSGTVRRIDPDGALVLDISGSETRVVSGRVTRVS